MAPVCVDIGVFAHNEEAGIAAMLATLARQSVLTDPDFDVRINVLSNGSRDGTAEVAAAALAATPGQGHRVHDLAEGGKSRTWNRFVHDLSRPAAQVLICADADIDLPDPKALARLAGGLMARPGLHVLNSRPVKDIADGARGPLDRLIAMAGGTLDDWKTAICGQLYAIRAARARALHLPVGLPVEDGFLRAMVLTDALTRDEDLSRIDGDDGVFHLYASERSVGGLIRHQTRIVIGSALNAAAFAHLRGLPAGARRDELARAAGDDGWLGRVAGARLPAWPSGYVPVHFLTKRAGRFLAEPRRLLSPRGALVFGAGTAFDLVVWINAQWRMARGAGAGFW